MKQSELLEKLSKEISERSQENGSIFEVLSEQYEPGKWESHSRYLTPDLVVHNKDNDQYMILELKHYDHKRPLSLSTVPLARQLRIGADSDKVSVTVMTNSIVSDLIRDGLKAEHVTVIEYTQDDQLTEKVWNFLNSNATKPL